MKFEDYLAYFEDILNNTSKYPMYNDPEYFNYTKMNWTRMSRWLKRFEPNEQVKNLIHNIDEEQTWIVITEPWCGDAAHSVPQLYNIVKDQPQIKLEINLRDSENSLIDQYLTGGSKSIPILVIRNSKGEDLAVWGPRPAKLQEIFLQLKEEGKAFEEIKEVIQKWYNEDKGAAIQEEILGLLAK